MSPLNRLSASQISEQLRHASFEEVLGLCEQYEQDSRSQVQQACARAIRRYEHEQAERDRVDEMYTTMSELGGKGVVIGVDEVGRGSVAGPLTVCAVCLPDKPRIWGLNDSKKLTPARREELAACIAEHARAIGLCHIPPARIDEVGIAQALREAVAEAVTDTGITADCVLMDGNPLGAVANEKNVIKGDAKVACIAAASIVAKVTRDAMMVAYDGEYPGYYLAKSKGYGSPEHIEAIKRLGLSKLHRATFCENFL